jgi:MoxR-like ATPase
MFWERFLTEMQSQFIDIDNYARAIALALTIDKSMIAWGPGGHGKSEGIQHGLHFVRRNPDDVFVQTCGEGMTEERLFGGPDLRALEEERVIRYRAEHSFLAHPYVVFEEMLDMPETASLSLRDTLSARMLRNGEQRFPMQTRSIFALTNREPEAKAGNDQSVLAFMERFPLQLRVAWVEYSQSNYARLLAKLEDRQSASEESAGLLADELDQVRALYRTVSLNGRRALLSAMLEKASQNGIPISPRVAGDSMQMLKAGAALRGSEKVEDEDFVNLAFSPALSNQVDSLLDRLAELKAAVEDAERKAAEQLAETERAAAHLLSKEELIASFATRMRSLLSELDTARGDRLRELNEELTRLDADISEHQVRSEVVRRCQSKQLVEA